MPETDIGAAAEIDAWIAGPGDWRTDRMTTLRALILGVDPGIEETWKWMGSPVWERDGIICVGGIYQGKVKLTFHRGAALEDPTGLFNAELNGNQRRAIDFPEDAVVDEDALRALIRAAIAHNQARRAR
ncbi:DUF1801 domain-containing protein [Curtobacterium sp. Leaf261]|uniref:DUF1801 domain-containing protein n=1 Tax=Curtobacterium sp. Leaf261 TaxID=1736311 RepID=UPI0006FD5F26|nr:DUF1801 domain-containing protein [Curtobacterium sp. Leaf261]KQO60316.1 hypothetical protein ASF23_13885 [Curtobacterium sp. Leaf261]